MKAWLGHMNLVYNYAKCKDDLLNTSAVISQIKFEYREKLNQDNQQFGPKNITNIPGP